MRYVLLVLLLVCPLASAAEARKPNILLVLIDDMGYGDLSCFGGKRALTPRIDQLATEGIRFTQFYVNAPICSPSRVALTTGQYPQRWRITSFLNTRKDDADRGIADWLDPAAPTLARILHDGGYYTAHVGKWHMGGQRDVADAPPISRYGFDASLTNFEGLGERVLPTFAPKPDGKPFVHGPTDMSAKFGGDGVRWVDREKVTAAFVDRAIEEIERATKLGKPFYINLWPDDVHSPVSDYVRVLETMDRELGRAFEIIRTKPELRDNTIILLMSDNGPERGLGVAGPFRGFKAQLYEGGIRSPLIVWSPRLVRESGKTNDATVLAGMDVAPSLLAIAGVATPVGVHFDGLDMSAALLGETPTRRSPVMWSRPPDRPGPAERPWPDLAIRDGDWKLLMWRKPERSELYDLAADPGETRNLAEQNPEVVRMLGEQLSKWDENVHSSPKSD
jgi:uncharacterized sulfatase